MPLQFEDYSNKNKNHDDKGYIAKLQGNYDSLINQDTDPQTLQDNVSAIADTLTSSFKKEYNTDGIDGVYTFNHPFGCSQMGGDLELTRNILSHLRASLFVVKPLFFFCRLCPV